MKILATQKYVFVFYASILTRYDGETLQEQWTTPLCYGMYRKMFYLEDEESLIVSATGGFILKYDMTTLERQWVKYIKEYSIIHWLERISSHAFVMADRYTVTVFSVATGDILTLYRTLTGMNWTCMTSLGHNQWVTSCRNRPLHHWKYDTTISVVNEVKEVQTLPKDVLIYHPSVHKIIAFDVGNMEVYDCRTWTCIFTYEHDQPIGRRTLVPGTWIEAFMTEGDIILTNGNRIIKTEPGEAFSFLPSGNKMIVYDQGILRKVDIYQRDRMMSLLHGQSHFPSVMWRMVRQKI